MTTEPPLAGDLLEGAREIAAFLYGDASQYRRVQRAIEAKRIPVFRIGSRICARKTTILRWITAQELGSTTAQYR